jgi:hypothetical protein
MLPQPGLRDVPEGNTCVQAGSHAVRCPVDLTNPAIAFKSRYATLGFSDKASLDDGHMWPTEFALKKLTAADERRIVALVEEAVS